MPRAKTCARNRPVSDEGGQAGLKRGSHNDLMIKIALIAFKPAEFKVKVEIYLRIENLSFYLNQPIIS
jgi:hypothetical protein